MPRPDTSAGSGLVSHLHETPPAVPGSKSGLADSPQPPQSLPPCLGHSRTNVPSLCRHYAASTATRVAPALLLRTCHRQYACAADPPFVLAPLPGTRRWRSSIKQRGSLRVKLFEPCSAFARAAAVLAVDSLSLVVAG